MRSRSRPRRARHGWSRTLGLEPLELRGALVARCGKRRLELGHALDRHGRLRGSRERRLALAVELGTSLLERIALGLQLGEAGALALELGLQLGRAGTRLTLEVASDHRPGGFGECRFELAEPRLPLTFAQLEQLTIDRRLEPRTQLHDLDLVLGEPLSILGRRLAALRRLRRLRLMCAQERLEALDLGSLRVREARILEQALGDLHALALVHQLELQLVDPPLELQHGRLQLHGARGALDGARAIRVRLQHGDGALALLERPLAVAHHRLELLQDLLALLTQAGLELELVRLPESPSQRARTLGPRDLVEAALDLLAVEPVVDVCASHDRTIDSHRARERSPLRVGATKASSAHDMERGNRCSILRHARERAVRRAMRQRSRSERGQAFALMVVALIALLGTAAIVMDVGFAWYAKRQVQASADAAALAGAQELPDVTKARAAAVQYFNLNKPANLTSVDDPIISFACAPKASLLCTARGISNTIQLTENAKSPSWFAQVLGITDFSVKGVATACQPCSSAPVDVMLVIDRTGSMCSPTGPGGSCIDLDNAKDGVRTLLGILDPAIDRIGLVAFPGYTSTDPQGVCGNDSASAKLAINGMQVTPNNYDVAGPSSQLTYLDDLLGNDFKLTSGATVLNDKSPIVEHMVMDTDTPDLYGNHNCIQSMGSTSYADALQVAKNELDKDGRPDVPHVIVFMTDGEANMGSYQAGVAGHGLEPFLDGDATGEDMPGGISSTINPGDAQPCHTAIDVARAIKAEGVTIYSIGYALGNAECVHGVWGEIDKSFASSGSDWANFRCSAIGAPLLGPHKDDPWAQNPQASHMQGIYSPAPGNHNPCTNDPAHTHVELPLDPITGNAITSYQTLQSIASPGNFYNKPKPGDMSAIFAAIAADITSGTSRLVDDSWGTGA